MTEKIHVGLNGNLVTEELPDPDLHLEQIDL